jgi:hypothetical protein
MEDCFENLLSDGVVVIPGPVNVSDKLNLFFKEQKEFISSEEEHCILGAFGAYGNPSSFHHPEIREIRGIVHSYMWPYLQKIFPGKNAEMLLDRFCKRTKGTKTSPELWHRDITNSPNILKEDKIFGGWINLDKIGSKSQGFSCIPGSQRREDKTGFVRFSDKENKEFERKKKIYEIPPGNIIMFNQDIVHEVLSKKATFDSYRLFIGWRITESTKPLYDNEKIIADQGIIKLPGGMYTPMYGPSFWMFHRNKILDWSKKVKPEFRELKLYKKENIYLDVVQQYMISLKDAGVELFRPYSEEEKKILLPQSL